MKNVSDEDFANVMAGLGEAVDFMNGAADLSQFRVTVPAEVDVRAIRTRMGYSRAAFAAQFGFQERTVQDREQGRRRPEASARLLLTIIDKEPEAVRRVLHAA